MSSAFECANRKLVLAIYLYQILCCVISEFFSKYEMCNLLLLSCDISVPTKNVVLLIYGYSKLIATVLVYLYFINILLRISPIHSTKISFIVQVVQRCCLHYHIKFNTIIFHLTDSSPSKLKAAKALTIPDQFEPDQLTLELDLSALNSLSLPTASGLGPNNADFVESEDED